MSLNALGDGGFATTSGLMTANLTLSGKGEGVDLLNFILKSVFYDDVFSSQLVSAIVSYVVFNIYWFFIATCVFKLIYLFICKCIPITIPAVEFAQFYSVLFTVYFYSMYPITPIPVFTVMCDMCTLRFAFCCIMFPVSFFFLFVLVNLILHFREYCVYLSFRWRRFFRERPIFAVPTSSVMDQMRQLDDDMTLEQLRYEANDDDASDSEMSDRLRVAIREDEDDLDEEFIALVTNKYCNVCRGLMGKEPLDPALPEDCCEHIKKPQSIPQRNESLIASTITGMRDIISQFDHPLITRALIPTILFFANFLGCSTIVSKIACILQFLNNISGNLVSLLVNIIDEICPSAATSLMDNLSGLEARMQQLEDCLQRGSYAIFIKVLTLVGCLPLLNQMGIHSVLGKVGMLDLKIIKSGMRTDEVLLDLSRSILTVVKHVVEGGSDVNRMGFTRFVTSLSTLVQYETNRSYGNAAVGNSMLNRDYVNLLVLCQRYQREIQKRYGSMGAPERSEYTAMFRTLDGIVSRNNREAGDFSRDAPFVIGITGIPGCGKTTIAKRTALASLQAMGYTDVSVDNIFEKNTTEWWDGYNPAFHLAVIVDELGALADMFGGASNCKLWQTMLPLTSEQPMLTAQAIAENKSGYYMKAPVIILMSNKIDFGAQRYLSNMAAFGRRFHIHMHIPSVHDRFRSKIHEGLDPALIPSGEIDTVTLIQYFYDTDRFVPKLIPGTSKYVEIDMYQFLDDVRLLSVKHHSHVIAARSRLSHGPGKAQCSHGFFRSCPDCHVLESSIGSTNVTPTSYLYLTPLPVIGIFAYKASKSLTVRRPIRHLEREYAWLGFLAPSAAVSHQLIAVGIWASLFSFISVINFFLRTTVLEFVVSECKRRTKEGSRWLSHATTLPDSLEGAVRRWEDRYIGTYIDVDSYRSLLRVLVTLSAGCAIVVTALRANKNEIRGQEPFGATSGSDSPDSVPVKFSSATIGRPAAAVIVGRNVWASPELYAPFGPSSCNEGLRDRMLQNTVLLRTGESTTHALGIGGQFYIYTSHTNLLTNKLRVFHSIGTPVPTWQECFSCEINEKYISKVNEEINMVYLPGTSPRKSLIGWMFRQPASLGNTTYESAIIDFDAGSPVLEIGKGKIRSYKTVFNEGLAFSHEGSRLSYHGRCGTPIELLVGKQRVLYGINIAGVVGEPINFYYPFDATSIERARALISCGPVCSTSGIDFSDTLNTVNLGSNCPITRHHHHHYCSTVGTEEILAVDPRRLGSTLTSSVKIDSCREDVFKAFPMMIHDLMVPIFKHGYFEGKYVSMEGHAISELTRNFSRGFNLSILDRISGHLIERWGKACPIGSLHVLDIDSAVRGSSSLKHLNAVKKSTSAGFPLKGKKGDFMQPCPSHDAPDGYTVVQSIKDKISADLASYQRNERTNAVWTAHFKDEPRSSLKVEQRKIRMFSGGELGYLVTSKAVFGMALNVILSNPWLFETSCGTNCFGIDWKDFALRHAGGTGVINSDFKTYDKTIPAIIMQHVFTILAGLMSKWYSDWCPELSDIVRGLMTECVYPIYNIDGLFCSFAASNPSGQFLTLLCNGFAQSVLMRYCFCLLYPGSDSLDDFDKSVVLTTLGDDGTQTVHDRDMYNYTNIKIILDHVGMTITPAVKDGVGVDYDPIGSNGLGKRGILLENGRYLCPMEFPAIGKMITTCLDNSIVPIEDKMTLSFEAAAAEFAMHGRLFFEENIGALREIAEKHGYLSGRLKSITFNEIIERFDGSLLTPHIVSERDDV